MYYVSGVTKVRKVPYAAQKFLIINNSCYNNFHPPNIDDESHELLIHPLKLLLHLVSFESATSTFPIRNCHMVEWYKVIFADIYGILWQQNSFKTYFLGVFLGEQIATSIPFSRSLLCAEAVTVWSHACLLRPIVWVLDLILTWS